MTAPTSGRGSARSSRPPPRSSRRAPGPGAGCSSSTGCPPTGCTSPSPASPTAELAAGTATGGALLCVAAVTFDKGHDVLLDALATISELSWHCACVGSLDRDPAFVEGLRRRSADARTGRPRALPGTADRGRSRPQLRRRRPDRAGLARRDLRHGRHRGPGSRPAGDRRRRRRGAARPSATAPTGPGRGCSSRRRTRSALGAALRAWLGDAELRARLAPGRRASGASRCPAGRPPRRRVAGVLAGASR